MLRLVQADDVTSESKALDPSAIEICDTTKTPNANKDNCPDENTGQDLLCRLFTIFPEAANVVNLATSTALLTDFDYTAAEKGNDNSIITVKTNGCKDDQCRHADGSKTALTFAYDHDGDADQLTPPQTNYAITATCDCDESKGETANTTADTADPFECICDADQERFQRILVGH